MQVEISGLSKRFGGLQALDNVCLGGIGGEVTCVIGPNGAGKSTLLDCLSGITAFDRGAVTLDGVAHARLRAARAIELGITRTFQNIRVFDSLTVAEHVALARLAYRRSARAPRRDGDLKRVIADLLDRVGLREKAHCRPLELSYGERRHLEIARGLATEPRLFLLDEPAAGSTLSEHVRLAALIRSIAASGTAVFLVEHHMDLVAEVAAQVVVLNFGRVITTGTIGEIRCNPEVIAVYLGVEA